MSAICRRRVCVVCDGPGGSPARGLFVLRASSWWDAHRGPRRKRAFAASGPGRRFTCHSTRAAAVIVRKGPSSVGQRGGLQERGASGSVPDLIRILRRLRLCFFVPTIKLLFFSVGIASSTVVPICRSTVSVPPMRIKSFGWGCPLEDCR